MTMTRKNLETIGYIACDPTAGDCASNHGGTIQPTYERARQDIDETRPTVRCVGSDGYLYVDEPENDDITSSQYVLVRDGVVVEDLGREVPGSRESDELIRRSAGRNGGEVAVVDVERPLLIGDEVDVDEEGVATLSNEPEPEPEDDDTLVEDSVQLINPWSGAAPEEYCLSWSQIVDWAGDHVHESDRDEWLAIAKTTYDRDDGETLGLLIIGS